MVDTAAPTVLTQVLPAVAATGDNYKFGAPPPPQGELKPSSTEEMGAKMYANAAPVTYEMPMRVIEKAALEHLDTPDVARAEAARWAPVFQKYEVGDATPFAEAIASVRAGAPDAARLAQWTEKSRAALVDVYQDQAGVVLQRTQRMLDADPKFKAELKRTGLGSNPNVVLALAASAERMRMAGKLK